MPLTTFEDLKTQLPGVAGADDGLLAELQQAADHFIETYCDRAFTGGSYVETHPAGAKSIFVKNFPVLDVTSIRIDRDRTFDPETEIPANLYVVHRQRGVATCLSGPFLASRAGRATKPDDFPDMLEIRYTTPADDVPTIVRRASVELTMHWYRAAKTSAGANYLNLLAARDGEVEAAYPWRQSGGYQIPDSVLDLLQVYRVPAL